MGLPWDPLSPTPTAHKTASLHVFHGDPSIQLQKDHPPADCQGCAKTHPTTGHSLLIKAVTSTQSDQEWIPTSSSAVKLFSFWPRLPEDVRCLWGDDKLHPNKPEFQEIENNATLKHWWVKSPTLPLQQQRFSSIFSSVTNMHSTAVGTKQ